MVAASTLLLSSTYKTSVFSEINPIFPYSFSIKIVPTERSFESQNSKKIRPSSFGQNQFLF